MPTGFALGSHPKLPPEFNLNSRTSFNGLCKLNCKPKFTCMSEA